VQPAAGDEEYLVGGGGGGGVTASSLIELDLGSGGRWWRIRCREPLKMVEEAARGRNEDWDGDSRWRQIRRPELMETVEEESVTAKGCGTRWPLLRRWGRIAPLTANSVTATGNVNLWIHISSTSPWYHTDRASLLDINVA
jgi:hypothetical protein